jgi:hypothetical protein
VVGAAACHQQSKLTRARMSISGCAGVVHMKSANRALGHDEETAMIDPYTAATAWQMANRTEADRRAAEEVTGRIVAAIHRLLRRSVRAPRTRSAEESALRHTTITGGRVA